MVTKSKKDKLWKISPQIFMFVIGIVLFWYGYLLLSGQSLEVGLIDWGFDLGYTQLFWGILLVLLSISLLIYPIQDKIKSKTLDEVYLLFISFPLGVAFYFLVAFAWVSHFPNFSAWWGTPTFNWGDKVMHFITTLTITLLLVRIFLKLGYSGYLALFVTFLIASFYELFEVVIIFNFAEVWNQVTGVPILFEDVRAVLFKELTDIIPDTIFNLLGIFFGYVLSRDLIRKSQKRSNKGK